MKQRIPHIQVDAFPLVDDHFSGVGHYTQGIVGAFDEMAGEGKLTYSLIVPRKWADRLQKYGFANYKKIIRNPVPNRVIRGILKFDLPFPVDVVLGRGCYYFPSFLAWPMLFSRSTVVVHDITYVAVPECVDKGNREYLARVVPRSLRRATNVVTVSQFSKDEVIKYYNFDPDKLFVARPSVDRRHFYRRSPEEIHKAKAKYDIFSEKYILAVGNVEPRKNYDRLIAAYVKLPKYITDEYPLVIVGAGGWNNKHIVEAMQAAKEQGYRIINPKQFVLDEDMPALFSGATFYVFVPIYEGFGMSPAEAYACGTPVIASKVASVPEAAGEAAIYTSPYDVDDIAQKLSYMFDALQKDAHQFDAKMEQHLASLSWRPSAEVTAAALTGLPLDYFKKGELV